MTFLASGSMWVEKVKMDYTLGGAYREHTLPAQPEPNISNDINQQEYRWNKFTNQWIAASNKGPCLIIGDLNLDILTWNDPEQAHVNMVDKTKDEISTRNFTQVVKGATRFCRDTRPSLIDHIWVNTPGKVSSIKNNTRGTADHNYIAANYRLNGTITSNIVRKGRDRRNFSEEELKRRTNLTDWNPVFNSNNVDIACFEFESKFVEILDDLAPIKTVQNRNKRCDWISPTTKKMMKDRDNTRNKAVISNQLEDWAHYRQLKNKCTTKIKQDRSKNLKDKYEKLENENDSAGLYKLVKSKMGWKNKGNPELFLVDGNKITNPKQIADKQVKYYHNKVNKLIDELPQQTQNPLETLVKTIDRWGKMNQVTNMTIQSVGTTEVSKIIKEMNGSLSYGHDRIDMKALKVVADSVAAPIAYIINLSIQQEKFPSRRKLGRIVPIYKGGDKNPNLTESFHPISLLPAVSKIAEKVVQLQLTRHMDLHNLWNMNLHSYRKSLSANTALAQVHDISVEASEDRNIAAAIAIDESAAFDSISHSILIDKIRLYRMDESVIKWISDYLKFRTQYVTIGGKDSIMKPVYTGVPQGSTLGPTLNNLYINDFPEIVNDHQTCQEIVHQSRQNLFGNNCKTCGNISAYADDAIFTMSSKHRDNNQARLEIMLKRMKDYLNNNKMTVNPTKTLLWEFMVRQKACKTRGAPPHLDVLNEQGNIKRISAKTSAKCLGATLQNNLQWQAFLETGEDPLIPTLRKKNLEY